jgi:hypothetical protein
VLAQYVLDADCYIYADYDPTLVLESASFRLVAGWGENGPEDGTDLAERPGAR